MEASKSPATSGVARSLTNSATTTLSHSWQLEKCTGKIENSHWRLSGVVCRWTWTWDISKASLRPMPIPTPQWDELPEKNNSCPNVVQNHHHAMSHKCTVYLKTHVAMSARKSSNRVGSRMLYTFLVITSSTMTSWQWATSFADSGVAVAMGGLTPSQTYNYPWHHALPRWSKHSTPRSTVMFATGTRLELMHAMTVKFS